MLCGNAYLIIKIWRNDDQHRRYVKARVCSKIVVAERERKRETEREGEREQYPFFTPTQSIVARRLPMHTYRKRRTRSSIQGDSKRREVGAPTLRKRRMKPNVSADLRAVLNRVYRLHKTAHYSSLLLLRGVAAKNLLRSAADAVRN